MRRLRFARANLLTLTAVTLSAPVLAGEVSGVPTNLPPHLRPEYTFFLGNDYFAPGTNDDFRTQQIVASARVAERWLATLDHSMFTRRESATNPDGRIDTMTLTLGYEFAALESDTAQWSLAAGLGARSIGNFEGARIQNGFHRLIDSGTSDKPYTSTRSTDPVAWLQAEGVYRFYEARGHGLLNGWDLGVWGRGAGLASGDGSVDGVAGAYLLASRSSWDIWVGLRRDWRSGYDADFVLRESMEQEDRNAFVYGLRFGSLVIETVARADSAASYGQVSFVSSAMTRRSLPDRPARADLQLTLHPPQITLQVALRYYTRLFTSDASVWSESILGEFRAGQPQLGRDTSRFVETYQATVGLELSRPIASLDWLRFYGNASAGVRSERLFGREELLSESADSVSRGVLAAESGVEIDAARLGSNWHLKLRFGATGWLPFSDATQQVGNEPSTILEPGASIVVGWVFSYY